MGLEVATYIHQLNASNPVGAVDPKGQGDDHIRMLKATIQATFPNITGPITVTQAQLNAVGASGITGFAIAANKIKGTGAAGAGVATTALRSDAQIVIDLTDAYAWTGQHSWTTQLRAANGSVGAPAYSFSGLTTMGFYRSGSELIAVTDGVSNALRIDGTNHLLTQDGNAARPIYSFEADTDTGIFRESTNTLAFATAGVRAGFVDGTGNLEWRDGSATFPAYSFVNDPDSGLYRVTTNTVGIATNGGLKIQFTATDIEFQVRAFTQAGSAGSVGIAIGSAGNTGFYNGGNNDVWIAEGGSGNPVGYRNIPQNSQSGNYTAVLADSGKHLFHPNGGGAGDTFTIPANASVAYPIGTVLTFVNRDSNSISIAITSDTMVLAGTTSTGTRTLAQNGIATAIKTESTIWMISGTGLS
jgi:hypothetical protein